jgi:hypothetical protein
VIHLAAAAVVADDEGGGGAAAAAVLNPKPCPINLITAAATAAGKCLC